MRYPVRERISTAPVNLHDVLRGPKLLASDWIESRQRPVYVAGFARSGTSWLGKVLSTAAGVRYHREPFNYAFQPGAAPYHLHYLSAEAEDPGFEAYLRDAVAGRIDGPTVDQAFWERHRRYRRWPARPLIKDVHTLLALERVERVSGAHIVLIVRHPCAVAASWRRLHERDPSDSLFGDLDAHLDRLQRQEALQRAFPQQERAPGAPATYLEKVGALWAAVHAVLLRQVERHPDWVLVRHEDLCAAPGDRFRDLFARLHLEWTPQTTDLLEASTHTASERPYGTSRVSTDEVDKWRQDLTGQEAEEVLRFVRPLGLDRIWEGPVSGRPHSPVEMPQP